MKLQSVTTPHMRYEWDEAKPRINLTRHGIDFLHVAQVFDGLTLDLNDNRYDYGETRLFTLGLLNGEVVAISYTQRDDLIRLITARRASRNEEITYFKEIWN
jgi:uncharacterized DUF497 family protein